MADRVDASGAAHAGSQLQTQLYVNKHTGKLDDAIRGAFAELAGAEFDWRSPLAGDSYAEYKDAAFLKSVGLDAHADALKRFWPASEPRWDALAVVNGPGDAQRCCSWKARATRTRCSKAQPRPRPRARRIGRSSTRRWSGPRHSSA